MVIFDYPKIEGNDYGILTDEHFNAMEKFWTEVVQASKLKAVTDLSQVRSRFSLAQ